jgi:hypothetical protein
MIDGDTVAKDREECNAILLRGMPFEQNIAPKEMPMPTDRTPIL